MHPQSMTDTCLYLAYGSNLHPLRLKARVDCELVSRVNLPGFGLRYHKRGADGSGKCSLVQAPTEVSHGALYRLRLEDIPTLDQLEGGYGRYGVTVHLHDQKLKAFSYLAQPELIDDQLEPYDWYRQLVSLGAAFVGFDQRYQTQLAAQPARADTVTRRAQQLWQLCHQLQHHNATTTTPALADAKLVNWHE